jgi:hypothetical protein
MAKDKRLLSSELAPGTQKDIAELISYLSNKEHQEKEFQILSLAQKLQNNPLDIHHLLIGENDLVVGLALYEIRTNRRFSKKWALIILNAAKSQTYADMEVYTQTKVLQCACANNNPKLAKKLLSALSQEAIIKLLNNDPNLFTGLFNSLHTRSELIEILLKHFPFDLAAEVCNNDSLEFFAYAALISKDATRVNTLIAFLPPQRRGIILGKMSDRINNNIHSFKIRKKANSIIIKHMTTEDVTAAQTDSYSRGGVKLLTEEAILHDRVDLVNAILDQTILRDKDRSYLRKLYLRDTITNAACFGQIDIFKTAIACYAYYEEESVAEHVKELATRKGIPRNVQALLTNYPKLDSSFRQDIEQIKALLEHKILPSEALARVKEAKLVLKTLAEDNLLIPDLANIVADCLRLKKPASLPSSSLNSSNSITIKLTQPVADNEFVGDEGIPIDKPYVTEGIDILLPDVIPDSGYSSTTSSSTTTASQSTAGGTIRWADDEDISAISHVKDDHKARKASPKTSWQQRHEDSRSATHSTSSLPVSSSHTRSQRLAASSEQNVVTESASATAAIRDSGWRAKVNKAPASFLKG